MSRAGTTAASLLADSSGSGKLQAGLRRWEGRRPATHGLGSLWAFQVTIIFTDNKIQQGFNLLVTPTYFVTSTVSNKTQQLSWQIKAKTNTKTINRKTIFLLGEAYLRAGTWEILGKLWQCVCATRLRARESVFPHTTLGEYSCARFTAGTQQLLIIWRYRE